MAAANLPKGKLTLTVHRGEELRDVQLIGKQDPYCELTIGSEKFKTKVHDDGGKNPVWNQAFLFNLDGKSDKLSVLIKDKEVLSDRNIARVDIPLMTLLKEEKQQKIQVYNPENFTQVAGSLYVTAQFEGTGGPEKPKPAAAAAPAPTPVVAPQQQVVYVVAAPQPQQVVYAAPQPQVVYQQPVVAAPAPAPAAYKCPVASKQPGWRWCNKCQSLFYSGLGNGVCAGGGQHDSNGSAQYNAPLANTCNAQNGWRWCCKCQVMFYGSTTNVCPLGGPHNSTGSGDYHVCRNAAHPQANWRWCRKCSNLHFGGLTGICAAGGAHDASGSGQYNVGHQ
jgi:hypothetical protein